MSVCFTKTNEKRRIAASPRFVFRGLRTCIWQRHETCMCIAISQRIATTPLFVRDTRPTYNSQQARRNVDADGGGGVSPSAWNKLAPRANVGGSTGASGNVTGLLDNTRVHQHQQQIRQFSGRRGARKGRQQPQQQLQLLLQRRRQQQEGGAGGSAAASAAVAIGSSSTQPSSDVAGAAGGDGGGGGAELAKNSSNASIGPWAKMMAPRTWGMSVAAGSAWSFSGGGSGGLLGHHSTPSPGHVSSTELAMNLYGGGGGGGGRGGNRARSPSRRGSL